MEHGLSQRDLAVCRKLWEESKGKDRTEQSEGPSGWLSVKHLTLGFGSDLMISGS